MNITTIQLHSNVKKELDGLKQKSSETYEEVIVRLVKEKEEKKRRDNALLIDGCKAMAEESLKITKEFEAIEEDFDWEW